MSINKNNLDELNTLFNNKLNIIDNKNNDTIDNKNNDTIDNKNNDTIDNNYLFNNKYIIEQIENNNKIKKNEIIYELKNIAPSLSDDDLILLYNKSISIHQSKIQKNGNFLENDILCNFLNHYKINYKKQVTINKNGIIVGFNQKKQKCYHIIDFVIGKNIEVGKSILDFIVISCKTTCRERWTQDDWSYTYTPLLYILLTISDDYPLSERFREDNQRKIITCKPKKNDDRIYKLNYEDLFELLKI